MNKAIAAEKKKIQVYITYVKNFHRKGAMGLAKVLILDPQIAQLKIQFKHLVNNVV